MIYTCHHSQATQHTLFWTERKFIDPVTHPRSVPSFSCNLSWVFYHAVIAIQLFRHKSPPSITRMEWYWLSNILCGAKPALLLDASWFDWRLGNDSSCLMQAAQLRLFCHACLWAIKGVLAGRWRSTRTRAGSLSIPIPWGYDLMVDAHTS